MPGVRIIAQSGDKRYEALSDAEGRFSIKDIPLGTYSVSFKLPPKYKLGGDYWDESSDDERKYYENLQVILTYGDNPNSLRIETRVDGRIRGKILDQNGKPAGKGIPVTLVSKTTANKEVGDIDYVHAFTNSKGEYEFFGIPAGEYLLGLNIETRPHKGFPYPRTYYPGTANLQNSTSIKMGMGEILDHLDLQLPTPVQEVEVRGVVVDINGNPVKGAIVEKYGLYSGEWREEDGYAMHSIKQPSFEGRVETDDRGEFSMKLLKGNKYRLNPFLPMKDSYKDLLEGDEIDIEVTDAIGPVRLVLDRKPE